MRVRQHRNTITMYWKDSDDTISDWDDACAWVVDTFGLPGNWYVTEITEDWMSFKFKDEKDALVMLLRFA